MKYQEEKTDANASKQLYLDGIESLIAQRQTEGACAREAYVKDIFTDPERYRMEFRRMLGWPLVDHETKGLPTVASCEKLSEEDGYTLYRMGFEILDGLVMTGLFFRRDGEGKRPLVIVQHGGLGTPERISGVLGTTGNYCDMLTRVIDRDVHAFAPQLLLWSGEYQVEFDRQKIDARLKRVGSSITAVEVYGIMRILDWFETQEYVSTLGMVGMSYGGFYALYTAAIDTRLVSTHSCSFFNSRDAVPWQDWTWNNSAFLFDDAEIAALVWPRRITLNIGTSDALFDWKIGVESFDRLKAMCADAGVDTDWAELVLFDAPHEFNRDDAPIDRVINDLK